MALKVAVVIFCLLVLVWMAYVALFIYRLQRRRPEVPQIELPPIPVERRSPKMPYDHRPIVIDERKEWERGA